MSTPRQGVQEDPQYEQDEEPDFSLGPSAQIGGEPLNQGGVIGNLAVGRPIHGTSTAASNVQQQGQRLFQRSRQPISTAGRGCARQYGIQPSTSNVQQSTPSVQQYPNQPIRSNVLPDLNVPPPQIPSQNPVGSRPEMFTG